MTLQALDLTIFEATTDSDFAEARSLFQEYVASLDVDLSFQNFAQELENIREVYSAPGGSLLLARLGVTIVGCVGFRPFNDTACEMKRLYVRPAARRMQLGRRLAVRIIHGARRAGYRRMVLDTLVSLRAAEALYRSLGFHVIQPYYKNPLGEVLYMELDLHELIEEP